MTEPSSAATTEHPLYNPTTTLDGGVASSDLEMNIQIDNLPNHHVISSEPTNGSGNHHHHGEATSTSSNSSTTSGASLNEEPPLQHTNHNNNNNNNNTSLNVQPTDMEMKKSSSVIPSAEKSGEFIIGGVDDDSEEAYVPKYKSDSPPLQLEWKDLTYKVKLPINAPPNYSIFQKIGFKMKNAFKKKEKDILHPMSGFVSPGSTLAIMGPSGAGKTSLLNILAQRVKETSGDITVNGMKIGSSFRSLSAFVQQDDVLMGNLSVRETLRYAALLRLPKTISWKEKIERVESIMDELGLLKSANTKVGTPGLTKGISGGERKRLSIAIELLTQPSILFLDEPTSGLDAATAYSVMKTIIKIAKGGRAVILTIHQPRSNIYELFDKLLLLARGKVAYFGPAKDATQYFAQIGYPCPKQYNPADHFIDLITESTSDTDEGKKMKQEDNDRIEKILNHYKHVEIAPSTSHLETDIKKAKYNANWFTQFFVVMARAFVNILRDKILTFSRLFQNVVMALLVGLIFLQIGHDQQSVQDRNGVLFFCLINQSMNSIFGSLAVFLLEEKKVFLRERGSKMYQVSAYYLGKSVSELPNIVFFPILFGTIVYWMTNLNAGADRFFIFLLILVSMALAAQALGMVLAVLAPSMEFATAIAPVLLTVLMLFGGLYMNVDNIPPYFIWIYWLSIFHFGYEAMVLNEFAGASFECPPSPAICTYRTGEDVIARNAMDKPYSNVWIDLGFLWAYFLIYRLLAYLILVFFVRPKKK
ncbi:hypothetical protein FDP41_008417 [Naegleria fowleri]|uniref:ABC transporter domain-containing protein n=1 Tax=Naegleria fowleri TaxID=5763 RepID=A0A6A5BGS6_NAEFO|nr:uncharacterized protein FDP41_008417 [Naegleria fowleri]KAF0973210.1 hypothetical protein FDP41_008417 [Naegleria fowleri]